MIHTHRSQEKPHSSIQPGEIPPCSQLWLHPSQVLGKDPHAPMGRSWSTSHESELCWRAHHLKTASNPQPYSYNINCFAGSFHFIRSWAWVQLHSLCDLNRALVQRCCLDPFFLSADDHKLLSPALANNPQHKERTLERSKKDQKDVSVVEKEKDK